MIKWTFAALYAAGVVAASLIFSGCGAEDPDAGASGDEIGTVEQDMTAPKSANFGFGATTGASHPACTTTNPSQVCLIPVSKSWKYCIDPNAGFTSRELSAISNAIILVTTPSGVQTTFGYTQVACTATHQIEFNALTCSGVCNGTSTIDGCVCSNPTIGSPITESEVGNFVRLEGTTIHLDRADVTASFGTNNVTADGVMIHGFAHALLVAQGIGSKGSAQAQALLISGSAVAPPSNHRNLSTGELCKMQNFNASSPNTFAYSGTCTQD